MEAQKGCPLAGEQQHQHLVSGSRALAPRALCGRLFQKVPGEGEESEALASGTKFKGMLKNSVIKRNNIRMQFCFQQSQCGKKKIHDEPNNKM